MNPIYNHTKHEMFTLVDYYEGRLFNDDGTEKDEPNAWIFIQELEMLYPELFA